LSEKRIDRTNTWTLLLANVDIFPYYVFIRLYVLMQTS